ncbi:serine hydrolase [Ramlibacter tataouinensis]|uniref:serine hydrolase domain-containing protein n=1 Tax=Ramlibacter tataouinensis TaxID=94132 RepID=UPI0022F384AC|nr:serine hydrolase [Ramlibacter tataouinensis]WBY03612.1 serine hydrolase [Ramlibacter tataouinensis]
MKYIKRGLLGLLVLLALAAAALQASGHGYIWNALRFTYLQGYNTAHIDDARNFTQARVAGGTPQPWPAAQALPLSDGTAAYLRQHRSAAFLVAQRGALVHESYFPPYGPDSRTNVFSMAKTLVTMLAGAAVADGTVSSFDAPLATWITEYAGHPQGRQATLAQLSAMTSGHAWDENYYLPLNPTTELYFGGDAQGTVLRQGFEREPGSGYEYSSASTQVLAIALQRALQAREPGTTLSAYASRRLWQPLGLAEASWSLDHPREDGGMELAYCCLHTSARNMARLAQLLLQGGQWNGQPVLPADFVQRMTTSNGKVAHYGHGLWMDPQHSPPFWFMQGHLGQYAIVVPSRELVIVRLGQWRTKERQRHPSIPEEVYLYVQEALAMTEGR